VFGRIRLTKIRKSLFGSGWKKETLVKGATFSLGQNEDKDDDEAATSTVEDEG
jgi:hypothetical protein